MAERILVVDDDPTIRKLITFNLSTEGYEVDAASSAAEAYAYLEKGTAYDLVMLDVRLPDADGTETLQGVRALSETVPVIMISAYATVDLAVQAVKMGAYDFIAKPFELDELNIRVRNAVKSHTLSQQVKTLSDQLGERYSFDNILGKSERMQHLFQLLRDISSSTATVLITGESGTGKELVAHALHANSPRRDKPFVVINSAAIPETLLESELFGHEKGSFTGAITRKIGKFEAASGGSIFLDEIGDLTPALQVKLLRVLQEKSFERVGGLETIKVDVRVISATNKNLEDEVAAKRFREDLYYRLNVLQVALPPRRERRDDIPMLTMHFVHEYADRMQKRITGVVPEAMAMLTTYPWHGNIRELENAIERAIVMAKGEMLQKIDFSLSEDECIPLPDIAPPPPPPVADVCEMSSVREREKEILENAIHKCDGNITRAAQHLGIGRDTLYRKIRAHGIDRDKVK